MTFFDPFWYITLSDLDTPKLFPNIIENLWCSTKQMQVTFHFLFALNFTCYKSKFWVCRGKFFELPYYLNFERDYPEKSLIY